MHKSNKIGTTAKKVAFFFALISTTAAAQNLPSLEKTLARFDSIEAARCAAAVAEFDGGQPPRWLAWMPAFGLAYTPSGKPRPALSYSLGQIFAARQAGRERAAKRAAVAADCSYSTARARAELAAAHRRAAQLARDIEEDERIFAEIDEPIFQFFAKKAENLELLPVELLEKRRNFENARERIRRRRVELFEAEQKIFAQILF